MHYIFLIQIALVFMVCTRCAQIPKSQGKPEQSPYEGQVNSQTQQGPNQTQARKRVDLKTNPLALPQNILALEKEELPCDLHSENQLIYDKTNGQFLNCNGAIWESVEATSTDPSSPKLLVGEASPLECPDGGTRFETWREENGNESPDLESELSGLIIQVVCNGQSGRDGQDGAPGSNAGLKISAALQTDCPHGGQTIELWTDVDGDGEYSTEIDSHYAKTHFCSLENSPPEMTKVVYGRVHACALFDNGKVSCWGANTSGHGTLGINTGTSLNKLVPDYVNVKTTQGDLAQVSDVSAGTQHTCALVAGEIYCFGYNGSGQLGDGTTTNSYVAKKVLGISDAVQISAGSQHTCALLASGSVKCWGYGGNGQLGNGQTGANSLPQTVIGIDKATNKATQVASGGINTCILKEDKLAYCFGGNHGGSLGLGHNSNTNRITDPAIGLTDLKSIIAGNPSGHYSYDFSCALTFGGEVFCFGYGPNGQLGNNSFANSNVPVQVLDYTGANLTEITSIAIGGFSACGLTSYGHAFCWGYNAYGQLGIGNTTSKGIAHPVVNPDDDSPLEGITDLWANGGTYNGSTGSVAVKLEDKRILSFGYNGSGQLGINNKTQANRPIAIHVN